MFSFAPFKSLSTSQDNTEHQPISTSQINSDKAVLVKPRPSSLMLKNMRTISNGSNFTAGGLKIQKRSYICAIYVD